MNRLSESLSCKLAASVTSSKKRRAPNSGITYWTHSCSDSSEFLGFATCAPMKPAKRSTSNRKAASAVKAAIGHPSAPKGGTPEYRNGPWYKKVGGKAQGDWLGKKKQFGYGAYADKKTRFITIEQNLSAIRKFYDEVLKDSTIANPARNARIEKVMRLP